MGGGGHHHGPKLKVPDYKIYRVEDVPELVTLKRALAARGLKDPWLRNEVWKYLPENTGGSKMQIFRKTMGRGMAVGFGLAVITTIIGKAMESKDDHHGEGHH